MLPFPESEIKETRPLLLPFSSKYSKDLYQHQPLEAERVTSCSKTRSNAEGNHLPGKQSPRSGCLDPVHCAPRLDPRPWEGCAFPLAKSWGWVAPGNPPDPIEQDWAPFSPAPCLVASPLGEEAAAAYPRSSQGIVASQTRLLQQTVRHWGTIFGEEEIKRKNGK